jgi:hypothetical protein
MLQSSQEVTLDKQLNIYETNRIWHVIVLPYNTCRPMGTFFMLSVATLPSIFIAKCEVRSLCNAPRIWRDFGSALPFQTRLIRTKPVLPLPNEQGSQVKDQRRRKCCHTKHKKFPYRPTRDVSLFSRHGNS